MSKRPQVGGGTRRSQSGVSPLRGELPLAALAVGERMPQCGQISASVLTNALHSRQGLSAM
jgi:hypothetical protein